MFAWVAACVRVLELDGDAPADDPADSAAEAPPGLCVPAEALGPDVPSARWALAALYASRRLDDRPGSALRLSPAWFLASGWQRTGFDCAAYGPPWVADAEGGDPGGCLGIDEGTAWNELCRLFPGEYACDGYDGALVGDRPEASALALAWFAVAAHGLLGRFELDPDDWYAAATDPRAAALLTATMHLRGPWANEVTLVLDGCADDVVACLDDDLEAHVAGVSAKLDLLEAAPCLEAPLGSADVDAFVSGLAAAHPGRDWEAARSLALAEVQGRSFSVEAPQILEALDASGHRLACPEQELYEWYRLPCP